MKSFFHHSNIAFVLVTVCMPCILWAQPKEMPKPLSVGYSIPIVNITPQKMIYAKSVGIDYIEASFAAFIDSNRNFKISDEELIEKVTKAKEAAEKAGIKVWSVHMPYGSHIDLSLANEKQRQEVVALHRKVLELCRILQPRVILFHPSYYLGLHEREVRKNQMIKSAIELNESVKSIDAIMVIENMLGPELNKDAARERPLCRTVEETVEIMNRLPKDIYSAIDMNHISHPERLIRAMGNRLKSVHIADGNGREENHYLPCNGLGGNNWNEILSALEEAHYTGPFMYESKIKDEKELKPCYDILFKSFISQKKEANIK
jgi:sugar phosphate isomerase/epimerase